MRRNLVHSALFLATEAAFYLGGGAFACQGQLDPFGYRLTISLFRYYGANDGEPKIYFSRFKGILQDKLIVLAEEIDARQPDFDYIRGLRLVPDTEEEGSSRWLR